MKYLKVLGAIVLFSIYLCWVSCEMPKEKSPTSSILSLDSIDSGKTIYHQSFNDSLFGEMKECLTNSDSCEITWIASYPKLTGDSLVSKQIKKTLGYSRDPNQILAVIDSFPQLAIRADTITSIRVSAYTYLIFTCNRHRIKFSWDPGRYQVRVERDDDTARYYKMDFDKLYNKSLLPIKQ